MYISLLKRNNHYFWVGPFNFNCFQKFAFKIMGICKCRENHNRSLFLIIIFGPYLVIIRTKKLKVLGVAAPYTACICNLAAQWGAIKSPTVSGDARHLLVKIVKMQENKIPKRIQKFFP